MKRKGKKILPCLLIGCLLAFLPGCQKAEPADQTSNQADKAPPILAPDEQEAAAAEKIALSGALIPGKNAEGAACHLASVQIDNQSDQPVHIAVESLSVLDAHDKTVKKLDGGIAVYPQTIKKGGSAFIAEQVDLSAFTVDEGYHIEISYTVSSAEAPLDTIDISNIKPALDDNGLPKCAGILKNNGRAKFENGVVLCPMYQADGEFRCLAIATLEETIEPGANPAFIATSSFIPDDFDALTAQVKPLAYTTTKSQAVTQVKPGKNTPDTTKEQLAMLG